MDTASSTDTVNTTSGCEGILQKYPDIDRTYFEFLRTQMQGSEERVLAKLEEFHGIYPTIEMHPEDSPSEEEEFLDDLSRPLPLETLPCRDTKVTLSFGFPSSDMAPSLSPHSPASSSLSSSASTLISTNSALATASTLASTTNNTMLPTLATQSNAILAILQEIFPRINPQRIVDIITVRTQQDGRKPTIVLVQDLVEELLDIALEEKELRSEPILSNTASIRAPTNTRWEHFFKSDAYVEGALYRLGLEFPITNTIVFSVFHNAQQDYVEAHRRLASLCERHPWFVRISTAMVKLGSFFSKSAPPSAQDPLLLQHMLAVEQEKRVQLEAEDRSVSLDLLREEYQQTGSLVSCQCCFAECIFEEMLTCRDAHLVCISCAERYIGEILYGQMGQTARPMDGIPCFALTDTPCDQSIPLHHLEPCISNGIYDSLVAALQKRELEQSKLPFVSCAACGNKEFCDVPRRRLNHMLLMTGMIGIFALVALVLLPTRIHFNATTIAGFATVLSLLLATMARWTKRRFLAAIRQEPFRCGHCHQWTCTKCSNVLNPFHRCTFAKTDEDNLRLVVEQAMTAAIVRVCPQCSVSSLIPGSCLNMDRPPW